MAIMRFDKLGKLISEDIALFKEKYGKNLKCYKYAHLPIHGIQALKKLRKNGLPESCGYTGTKVVTTFNTPVRFNSGDLGFAPGYNTATSSRTVSIGSILMVYVSDQITLDNNITGRTHHSQGSNKLQFCRSDSGSMGQAEGAPTVPDGTYIWLCDVLNTSSTFALVQCLSLD